MFFNCKVLKSLDLSSFSMEGATNITYMFRDNPKLEFINFSNSHPNENIIITGLFQGTSKNLVICSDSEVISRQRNIDCSSISCSENWREDQKKLLLGNCVDTCNNTEKKYDYLSECVSSCQKAKYTIEYLLKCVDICPISTYIND